jgi:nucleotide-binding universal stress UspA family protein
VRSLQAKNFEKAVGPARKLLAKAGAKADEVCLVGNAGDELAAYAKKKKLDLLVMGSHGYGAFRAAVMGSVATRAAATGDVPLLLIRHA